MCFYSGAFNVCERINLQFGSLSVVSGNLPLIAEVIAHFAVRDKSFWTWLDVASEVIMQLEYSCINITNFSWPECNFPSSPSTLKPPQWKCWKVTARLKVTNSPFLCCLPWKALSSHPSSANSPQQITVTYQYIKKARPKMSYIYLGGIVLYSLWYKFLFGNKNPETLQQCSNLEFLIWQCSFVT